MSKNLSADDSRAIDMILNRASEGKMSPQPYINHVSPARLRAAEKVLGMLDQLEDAEPPPDLVDKTLQRIAAHEKTVRQGTENQPHINTIDSQPQA